MLKISSVWFHVSYILILPNHSSELIMNYMNTLTSDTQIILLFLCCQCGSMVFTAMVTMFVCHNMQLRRKSFSLFLCQNFLPCAQDVQILFNFKLNFFFFFFLPISHFISLCFTQLILLLLSQKKLSDIFNKNPRFTRTECKNVISGLAFALVQYVYYEQQW